MLIEVKITVDDFDKLVKHFVGIVQKFVDVVFADDFLKTVDDFVLDFVGEVVNAAVIVVKRFAVDVGSVGNIFDGDVVDILFRKQFGKGAVDCFFGFCDTSICFFLFHIGYYFRYFRGIIHNAGRKRVKTDDFRQDCAI